MVHQLPSFLILMLPNLILNLPAPLELRRTPCSHSAYFCPSLTGLDWPSTLMGRRWAAGVVISMALVPSEACRECCLCCLRAFSRE